MGENSKSNTDKIIIAKKILNDAKSIQPVSPLRLDYIDLIMHNPENPVVADRKFTKSIDITVLCALMDTPNIPITAKEEALNTIDISSLNSSALLAQLLFYGSADNLKNLPYSFASEIVSKIKWEDFHKELNEYLLHNPDATKLPFANTNIEKCLFERILEDDKTPRNLLKSAYRFIEIVSNTKLLEMAIDKRFMLSPSFISALINNKNISDSYKQVLFEAEFDMHNIKFCSENKAKELYESVIFPISNSKDFLLTNVGILDNAAGCLRSLIRSHLLPESCEIDFVKRYINGDVWRPSLFISSFLNQTQSYTVLSEALNFDNPFLLSLIMQNPNTPYNIQHKVADKFLQDTTNREAKGSWSHWDKSDCETFAITCAGLCLPASTYPRLLSYSTTPYIHKAILTKIALNASIPQSILDSLVVNVATLPSAQTYLTFNKESRNKLLFSDAQKFLNTIQSIYEHIYEGITIPHDHENFFLPINDIETLRNLTSILDNIIKNETNSATIKCAQYYKNFILKKQIEIEAEQIIQTENVDISSLKALREAKTRLQGQILKPCESNLELSLNGFKFYLLYKNLINFYKLYEKIDNEIQYREQKEKTKKELLKEETVL